MDKEQANRALDVILSATDEIRSAEIRQSVALAGLAETYSVDLDTLVPELAEKTIHPGDEGTPGVSEFLCLELGPALGVSRRTALNMVAAVLNLKHRHPRTWDSFLRGLVPRWHADILVDMTAGLSAPAALDKTLSELAVAMGESGDERRTPKGRTVIHVHLAEETLVDPESGVARIEGFGPLTAGSLSEFLGGTHITVRPVVDDSRIAPVDAYEIPEQLRDAVHRGFPFEAFPYTSTTSGNLDLDHFVAYRFGHLWEPGQTSVDGLAPLSRLVHRAKTLGAWKLRRVGLAELCWTSPLGRHYVLGPRGARPPAAMIRRRE